MAIFWGKINFVGIEIMKNDKEVSTKINNGSLFCGVMFFLYFLIRIVFIDWIYGGLKGYKYIQGGKAGVLDIPKSDPV